MKTLSYVVLTFAILVLIGGIIGFVKAQSLASLAASSLSFILLVFCSVLSLRGKVLGLYLSSLVILALDVFFVYRFLLSKKLMPSGLMAVLSTILGIILLSNLTQKVKES